MSTQTPPASCRECDLHPSKGFEAWVEAIGMAILLLLVAKFFHITGLFTAGTSRTSETVGLGAIFIVGLVAASSSCIALVGGLLLSVSAAWCEEHQSESRRQRLQPFVAFNAGRLAAYYVLGGAIGAIGAAFHISTQATGFVTVALSIVMLYLGLRLLRLLPKKFCTIPLPRPFQQRLHGLADSGSLPIAAVLGAATFFIPCGFTQSMQLLALSSGSFLSGATIMSVFALGTLPSLLGISLLSSLAEGRLARWFLLFSGTLVLLLGLQNFQSGLLLLGIDTRAPVDKVLQLLPFSETATDPAVTFDNQGRQIIALYVTDQGYQPSSFTIEEGKTTWVYAVAPNGVSGCANFLLAPSFNLQTQIRQGDNWLGPIENPQHDFVLTCSMGMFRATVHVK